MGKGQRWGGRAGGGAGEEVDGGEHLFTMMKDQNGIRLFLTDKVKLETVKVVSETCI